MKYQPFSWLHWTWCVAQWQQSTTHHIPKTFLKATIAEMWSQRYFLELITITCWLYWRNQTLVLVESLVSLPDFSALRSTYRLPFELQTCEVSALVHLLQLLVYVNYFFFWCIYPLVFAFTNACAIFYLCFYTFSFSFHSSVPSASSFQFLILCFFLLLIFHLPFFPRILLHLFLSFSLCYPPRPC